MNQKYICPTCRQDMRDDPKDGLKGKNCRDCGQGLFWRQAARMKNNIKKHPAAISRDG